MTDFHTILKIEDSPTEQLSLHVEMSAANLISFDLVVGDIDHYHEAIMDICKVAPHMMALDVDLQEAYDNAFRTKPKLVDQVEVLKFLDKYKGRMPDNLREMFR